MRGERARVCVGGRMVGLVVVGLDTRIRMEVLPYSILVKYVVDDMLTTWAISAETVLALT